jgi:hypothetical protein
LKCPSFSTIQSYAQTCSTSLLSSLHLGPMCWWKVFFLFNAPFTMRMYVNFNILDTARHPCFLTCHSGNYICFCHQMNKFLLNWAP